MKKIRMLCVCLVLLLFSGSTLYANATEPEEEVSLSDLEITPITPELVNPIVYMESYSIETENVIYGEENNLHLVIVNESKTLKATDIMISYSSGNVSPVYGETNNIYIESMEPFSKKEIDLPICILSSSNGYVQMSFSVSYTAGWKFHSTPVSNIMFKISVGNSEQINLMETEDIYDGWQAEEQGSEDYAGTVLASNNGLDSTTIILGVGIIVVILALFGFIFGRKKK